MDDWAWQELQPWLTTRLELPVGPLFCVITGPTRGRRWSTAAARHEMRHAAAARPCAPKAESASTEEEERFVVPLVRSSGGLHTAKPITATASRAEVSRLRQVSSDELGAPAPAASALARLRGAEDAFAAQRSDSEPGSRRLRFEDGLEVLAAHGRDRLELVR